MVKVFNALTPEQRTEVWHRLTPDPISKHKRKSTSTRGIHAIEQALHAWLGGGQDLIRALRPAFSYQALGATVHRGAKGITNQSGECWVSDECLLVREAETIKLVDLLAQRR